MTYEVRSGTVTVGGAVILDDVTASVEPGQVLAVVGGDGAGKTTLLRAFVGEIALAAGTLRIPAPTGIGYMPARAGSWPALTVRQNMDFVAGIYGLVGDDLAGRRDAILARAGLRDVQDRPAADLSGGMRRKLGFCMAMVHGPALLVLDEPSTGVDPVSRIDLWRLVSEAASDGAAVVMSTTYLDEGERAGSLLALDSGRTLAAGDIDAVLGTFTGTITSTTSPRRAAWSWRRGRTHHECWPAGTMPPDASTVVVPDLEDVLIALSLIARDTAAAAS